MFRQTLLLLFVAAIVCSCNNSQNTGIVLSTVSMFDGPGASGKLIRYVKPGTSLEYTGDQAASESLRDSIKVRIDGVDGYIDGRLIAFNCKPAVVTRSVSGSKNGIGFQEGTFVAYDSVDGNNTHVYSAMRVSSDWIPNDALSFDPADIDVACAIKRLADGFPEDEMFRHLEKIASQYPTHPRLQTLKIDLSEAPEDFLRDQERKYYFAINKSQNTIIGSKSTIDGWARWYLGDILQPSRNADSPEGYEDVNGNYVNTIPSLAYHYKYVDALPSFVKMQARSYFAAMEDETRAQPAEAYFLYRLDRSPENISALYSTFKPLISEVLSSGTVQDVRPELQALIKIYDRIVAMPDHKTLLGKISRQVAEWDRKNTDKGYSTSMYTLFDQASIYEPIIDTREYDLSNDGHAIWYHSFWVRRFAEGNEKVVYDILKEISEMDYTQFVPYGETQMYGESDGEDEGEGFDEVEVITCVFKDYSIGDCGHMEFSCGDYGDADTSALSPEDLALWNALVISDSEGEHGNPEYVGKEFIIRLGSTTGPACNEGQGGEGVVPKIWEFRLVN